MEGFDTPEQADNCPSFGPSCHHCNSPDTSNMTWQDGVKNFFSTYLSSPRMGPLGYILGSQYSPFQLETELPSRNWRDAFEDLLALDLRGQMIPEAYRKAEDTFAAKQRYHLASDIIALSNTLIRENKEIDSRITRLSRVATKSGDKELAAHLADSTMRSQLKDITTHSITQAQEAKSLYESDQSKPASSLKSHCHWIASLITSGALPGWSWCERTSVDGPVVEFARVNAPPELEAGISTSDMELSLQFVHGRPWSFGSPQPLRQDLLQALVDGTLQAPEFKTGSRDSFNASQFSIMVQAGRAEPFKRSDGSTGTKVILDNNLANGTWTSKEFVQEPEKVFEEIHHARQSMSDLRGFTVSWPSKDVLDYIEDLKKTLDERIADYEDDSFL